jgi:hypothetical protein
MAGQLTRAPGRPAPPRPEPPAPVPWYLGEMLAGGGPLWSEPEPGRPFTGAEIDQVVRELASSGEPIEVVRGGSEGSNPKLIELRWGERMLGELAEWTDWQHRKETPAVAVWGERRWRLVHECGGPKGWHRLARRADDDQGRMAARWEGRGSHHTVVVLADGRRLEVVQHVWWHQRTQVLDADREAILDIVCKARDYGPAVTKLRLGPGAVDEPALGLLSLLLADSYGYWIR